MSTRGKHREPELAKMPREEAPKAPREEALPKPPRETPALAQTYTPIVCPYCGATKPRVVATNASARYFRCRECDLDGTGGTTFKVPVTAPQPVEAPRGPATDRG